MKPLPIIVFTATLLVGCDNIETHNSSGTLCGLSNFDGKFHFVEVSAKSGNLKVLNKLTSVTGVRGQVAIDEAQRRYFFTSEYNLIVIDIEDGSIINSFELMYPNTLNLTYNSNTEKLNALSYFDNQFHFVEIDPLAGEVVPLSTLTDVQEVVDGSASIDNAKNRYYFVTLDTLQVVDTETGAIIDSFVVPGQSGGLKFFKDDTVFGLHLAVSDKFFYTLDLETGEIKKLKGFSDGITGHSSLSTRNGAYYYFRDINTLNTVDIRSGRIVKTSTMPYPTNHLVPFYTKNHL